MGFTRSKRATAASASPYDDGRRRLRMAVLAVVGTALVAVAAQWWFGRIDPREGSRVVPGPAVRVTSVPTTYRMVYRVMSLGGKSPVVLTEKYWVRRPFESRIEGWSGGPPGKQRLDVRQSVLGVLTNRSRRAEPLNVAAPPSIASGDLRIDAVIADAVAAKTIERRERREVYGRACQVYRTGGPVTAGDVTAYKRGSKTFADVCVDRRGIVLEEAWTYRGDLLRVRTAVEVHTDVAIDEALFRIDVPSKPGPDRGDVSKIPPEQAARIAGWAFRPPPRGFDPLGKYAVVFPQSAQIRDSPLPEPPTTSVTDVYVRGPDVLVIDQDPSLATLASSDKRSWRALKLRGFKDAKVILDARMSEVRATDEDGSLVRVFGTLPPAALVRAARSLEHVGG